MKRLTAVALAFGLAVAIGFVPAASYAQKGPADFQFENVKGSPGTVTFSHEKHKEAGEAKCSNCHTKIFKMKKGPAGELTMAKMKAGEGCGACHDGKEHNGKAVFSVSDTASCSKCHSLRREGGGIGPDLSARRGDYESAAAWAATMWAHTPRMATMTRERGILYPRFTGDEMVNLVGFLRGVAAASPKP